MDSEGVRDVGSRFGGGGGGRGGSVKPLLTQNFIFIGSLDKFDKFRKSYLP